MRKLYVVSLAGLVVAAFSFGIIRFSGAQVFHTGNTVDFSANRVIDSSIYVAGRDITVASDVRGDIFCAGQNIRITGPVHGDVLCAGQNVRVTGKVDGNVRLAGQNVMVSGTIQDGASVIAQTFTLEDRATVGRDLSVAANDVEVYGTVGRDVALTTSTAVIASHIGRDVTATVTNLTLQDGALIAGNLSYTSNNTLTTSGDAKVLGTTARHTPTQQQPSNHHWLAFWGVGSLIAAVALLVFATVLLALFPKLFRESANTVSDKPLLTFGVGLGVAFVVPMIAFVLLVTIIGIPLAFLLGMTWLIAMMLSAPLFAFFIGSSLLGDKSNIFLAMALGVVVLMLLNLIPFVNFFSWLVTVVFGTGALGLMLVRRYRRPVYREI